MDEKTIAEKIMGLMRTSLAQQEGVWRRDVGEIREVFMQLQHQGFDVSDWVLHWECQLFKALEFQVRCGLLSWSFLQKKRTYRFHEYTVCRIVCNVWL